MVKYPLRRDNLPFYFLVTFNVYGGGSSEGRGRDYSGGTSISMVLMVVVGGWWWWWWPLSACLETARKMHGVIRAIKIPVSFSFSFFVSFLLSFLFFRNSFSLFPLPLPLLLQFISYSRSR